MSELIAETKRAEEMIEAGKVFAATLSPGDVVALDGPLGAGKTHFSKGLVAGLGASCEVTSPTFSLVHEYLSGDLPVFHFDFYRLDEIEELERIGWEEYLEEEGVVLVEWANKFPAALPAGTIRLEIAILAEGVHTVSRL